MLVCVFFFLLCWSFNVIASLQNSNCMHFAPFSSLLYYLFLCRPYESNAQLSIPLKYITHLVFVHSHRVDCELFPNKCVKDMLFLLENYGC